MAAEQPRDALLERTDITLRLPSLSKAAGVSVGISALLLGIGGGLFWEWSVEQDYLYPVGKSKEWRISNGDEAATDWRICSLELFSDEYCFDAIDLKSATPISSSEVPAGFKDSKSNCESVWSSGKQKGAYIGWSLPKSVMVGCIRATTYSKTTGCSYNGWCDEIYGDKCESGVQCDACCDSDTKEYGIETVKLQSQQGDGFQTVMTRSYSDEMRTFDGLPQDNNAKIGLLIAWILLFVFGGFGLVLVVPLVVSTVVSLRTKMANLQKQIGAGEACLCDATDAQWADFVEEHWGPKGAQQQAESGPIATLVMGLLVGCAGMALLKFRCWLKDLDISWSLCAMIMIPTGVVIVFLGLIATRLARRRRYAQCKREKFPLILGPESLYFGGVFVHGKQGCTSNCRVVLTQFVRPSPEKGCCMIVTYVIKGKTETTKKVAAPISEACLARAKAYVLQHRAFYQVKVTGANARASTPTVATPEDPEVGAGSGV